MPEVSAQSTVPGNSPFSVPINPTAAALAEAPPKEVTRIEAPKPITPGSKAWAEMSPDQRAAHQRAPTDIGRTSASVHTRDATGALLIDGKRADGSEPAPADAPAAEAPAATGEKIKIGEVELTAEEWAAAASHKAEADLRATQIPARGADYRLELPADMKLPDGIAVKLDPNDPVKGSALVAATEWAARNKLSQTQFSEMMGLYAASSINEHVDFERRQAAEFEALGTAGPVRIDAVTRWLAANFGAAAKPVISTLVTKAHVEVFEGIISKLNGRGSNFTQRGRDTEQAGIDDATWNSMSYGQRKEYAENASRGGGYRR